MLVFRFCHLGIALKTLNLEKDSSIKFVYGSFAISEFRLWFLKVCVMLIYVFS